MAVRVGKPGVDLVPSALALRGTTWPLRRCALFRSARSQRQCLCRCRRRRPCKDRSLDSYDVALNSGMFWLLVQPKTCKKHRQRILSNCSGRKRYFLLPASLFSLTSLVHGFVRCLTAVLTVMNHERLGPLAMLRGQGPGAGTLLRISCQCLDGRRLMPDSK